MSKQSKIDHLKNLGAKPHVNRITNEITGEKRTDIKIVGRRARKQWECAADRHCLNIKDIQPDEVYIEYATGIGRYNGKSLRYHVSCAINREIIQYIFEEEAFVVLSARRQAILAQKARKEIHAD